jgi:hypothetical protein
MQQRWPWAATQNLCSCSERRRRKCWRWLIIKIKRQINMKKDME